MRYLILFITLIIPFSLYSNEKTLRLKKIESNINIDGLVDAQWSFADSVDDFVQFQPYNGKVPTRKTTAKVLTTVDALYCLMICIDDKTNIQQNTGVLDNYGGDMVSIMLDTFGDNRTAYKFAVNAAGVRGDCRLLDDARNRDYSWDGVWFAQSKMYDWGYIVEMEIPYRSIQYNEQLTEWGLDFDRWIPALTEDIYWNPYEENQGQRISKFGKLIFKDFQPTVKGLNMEVYPVGIAKATYLHDSKYKIEPNAGIDIFYNPSQALTFQLTGNPDFAQIEADPYEFNISRYETYFSERRPFFTEGNEVFSPSGKQRNSGFYQPIELFYSRRIGKKLPDGSEVPLLVGSKVFGRLDDFEYGGFIAMTDEKEYRKDETVQKEDRAYFGLGRIKKQILENSSLGILVAAKHSAHSDNGFIDLDGAFRGSDWQFAYQLAESFNNQQGGFAASAGGMISKENWMTGIKGRAVSQNFNVDQVGFVPWKGTAEIVGLSGPRWYYSEGTIQQIMLYVGGFYGYEDADKAPDYGGLIGYNMQFRSNWGFEINLNIGKSKDSEIKYNSSSINFSTWFNTSPKWSGNVWGGYEKTYNFSRGYLSFYSWLGSEFSWRALNILGIGSSINMFVEGNPNNKIEDITYNTRPYFSLTPINDLDIRFYFDDVFVRSTDRFQQFIGGLLLSYNFLPKSWIYLAINELRDRSDEFDSAQILLPNRMHTTSRVGVMKIKYLYYF
jgi:hypothetical protein